MEVGAANIYSTLFCWDDKADVIADVASLIGKNVAENPKGDSSINAGDKKSGIS